MNRRWCIANMVWRIGEVLDFHEQVAWIREAGFDGVGFHASPGTRGEWQGVDPGACIGDARMRLRDEMRRLACVEVHAPFEIELRGEEPLSSVSVLRPIVQFAGDVAAGIVTVHGQLPEDDAKASQWADAMAQLDAEAVHAKTVVGLELVEGFDMLRRWNLSNIGVTLDVGHMYARDEGRHLASLGGIGAVIRQLGSFLVHLHLHDYDGERDHIECGQGMVDFAEIAAALRDINYLGAVCLELNPRRVAPRGILRSKRYLERCFRKVRET